MDTPTPAADNMVQRSADKVPNAPKKQQRRGNPLGLDKGAHSLFRVHPHPPRKTHDFSKTAQLVQSHGRLPGDLLKSFQDIPRAPLLETTKDLEETFPGTGKTQILDAVEGYGAPCVTSCAPPELAVAWHVSARRSRPTECRYGHNWQH